MRQIPLEFLKLCVDDIERFDPDNPYQIYLASNFGIICCDKCDAELNLDYLMTQKTDWVEYIKAAGLVMRQAGWYVPAPEGELRSTSSLCPACVITHDYSESPNT